MRARTVDHLGRGQIADAPTAVSELWKNSWDAYAKEVALTIFSSDDPKVVLTDDGHGMSNDDFFEKWLVIGTESKILDDKPVPANLRNGLPIRPKQGQKGIGRLSAAKLGAILFLITQRRKGPFFAALVNWRLFENPYVNLEDVPVATGDYSTLGDCMKAIPEMTETLASSIIEPNAKNWRGGNYKLRGEWDRFDKDWQSEDPNDLGLAPSKDILQSLGKLSLDESHLSGWSGPGTALMITEVDDALRAMGRSGDTDSAAQATQVRMIKTLSNFVDLYGSPKNRPQFAYRMDVVDEAGLDTKPRTKAASGMGMDSARVANMEHQIEGRVDAEGIFRGKIKAFGQWIDDVIIFKPPKDLRIPYQTGSCVGPFEIYLATMEWQIGSSTHSAAEHNLYIDLAREHAGMLIFRDGLRVLPYGREDNDFFEIEKRRTKNAGRHFWNHRRMFGRIALTRSGNPNLKDKAGREGLIDNVAARTFKELIINILQLSAWDYLGSGSSKRKEMLPVIKRDNQEARAKKEEERLRKRRLRLVKTEIEISQQMLPGLLGDIKFSTENLKLEDDRDVVDAYKMLSRWRLELEDYEVRSPAPAAGEWAERHADERSMAHTVAEAIGLYETRLHKAVKDFRTYNPEGALIDHINVARLAVSERVDQQFEKVRELLTMQLKTVSGLKEERTQGFKQKTDTIVAKFNAKLLKFEDALQNVAKIEADWQSDSDTAFRLYSSALAAVQERIDLETLASVQMRQITKANQEVERLNALAQLGIAVEITAHDLADYDDLIRSGLESLPEKIKSKGATSDIRLGLEGLTEHLRFLSPLRISGESVERMLTGLEIGDFIAKFFAADFARSSIIFKTTRAFRATSLFEKPSRIYPVFLNLVNNAIYWVSTTPPEGRKIVVDYNGASVVVADSGPGIEPEDVSRIFDLFFSRKQNSGRGVGLYLAQSNLAAGGHTIRYRQEGEKAPLDGAAFFIEFSGLEDSGE